MTCDPDAVDTRGEFVRFVRKSIEEKNLSEIENTTTVSFLASMAAWVEDMDGYFNNKGEKVPEDINWKFIATLISASKIYE